MISLLAETEKHLTGLIGDDFFKRVEWERIRTIIITVVLAVAFVATVTMLILYANRESLKAWRERKKAAALPIKIAKTEKIQSDRLNKTGYTVTLSGGESFKVLPNSTYAPPLIEREGYAFGGWFIDSAMSVPWLSTQKVMCDLTLYPKWIKE